MGLFGTKKVQIKETSIKECVIMIESFFKRIDFNPRDQRLPDRDTLGWWLQRGSALIYILLHQHDKMPTIRVMSPLLYLPGSRILPLYRRCLELNAELINCAFCVVDDKIMLVSERPIDGLDPQELDETIMYLSAADDEFDNHLSEEFNAPMYLEHRS